MQTILVKLTGSENEIDDFVEMLQVCGCEIVTKSQIVKNEKTIGSHCFLNVLWEKQ